MREIEKLANEKFDGDRYKALDYAYRNWGSKDNVNDRMRKLYGELTEEELKMAAQIIRNLAIERSGKDKVENFEKSIGLMNSLNLSDDDILAVKGNLYKKPMLISLFSMLLLIGVPFLIYQFASTSVKGTIEFLQAVLIGLNAYNLADNIRKFYLFAKAKKSLNLDGAE